MKKVTLENIRMMAEAARAQLWKDARNMDRDVKIYLHWTAGRYGQFFDDYHISINQDGTIYASTDDLSETLAHTWHRNTGAVGMTLCCCYGADTADLGDYPPTAAQIEAMAQVIAVLADGLWLTIDKPHVMTHGEAADNEDGIACHEPYGPRTTCERWDLEYLGTDESPAFNPWATDGSRGGDILRGKANWYRSKWKEEKQ